MPDYRWRHNNYRHPALRAAFNMSTLTPGGLMKNMTGDSTFDATINGTLVLANPLIKCKTTKCMDLDGATNWLALANPLNSLTNWSAMFWVNFDGVNSVECSSSANMFLQGRAAIGAPACQCVALLAGYTPPYKALTVASRTYFVAFTHDSTNLVTIYLDGRFYMRGVLGATPADANANIGRYITGASNYTNGRLDNMLFYNVALTPSQINSIYRSANPRM